MICKMMSQVTLQLIVIWDRASTVKTPVKQSIQVELSTKKSCFCIGISLPKMASDDECASDDGSTKSSRSDVNAGVFLCCLQTVCTFVICRGCSGVYHRSYTKRRKLPFDGDSFDEFCEHNDKKAEEFLSDNRLLSMEVTYLKRLLAEASEKYDILRSNNELLAQRVQFLLSCNEKTASIGVQKQRQQVANTNVQMERLPTSIPVDMNLKVPGIMSNSETAIGSYASLTGTRVTTAGLGTPVFISDTRRDTQGPMASVINTNDGSEYVT